MTTNESSTPASNRAGARIYPWLIAFAVALAVIGSQASGTLIIVLAIVAAIGYAVLTQPGYDRRRWALLLVLPLVGRLITG